MDYLVICDRTGFKKWRSECRKEWDGKLVWSKVWRRRQPQDTPPEIPEPVSIPDARPEGTDYFIGVNEARDNL
jgi:hypothetical protein